jgi:hypothetical protein
VWIAPDAPRDAGTVLAAPGFMPRYPHDLEIDPARNPDADRKDGGPDPDEAIVEPDRSVARHAEEAEEAELAEEDILEIADLEDELDARKGEGPDE